ncbi:MAG: type VI secretion system baseplate subunit TssK [Sphingomonadaceae bacterium]
MSCVGEPLVPGLELVHMAQVPMEVPVRPNAYYFSIENRGERYEAIMRPALSRTCI